MTSMANGTARIVDYGDVLVLIYLPHGNFTVARRTNAATIEGWCDHVEFCRVRGLRLIER